VSTRHDYVGPAWWTAIAELLPPGREYTASGSRAKRVEVCYYLTDRDLWHSQIFEDARLIAWVPGRLEDPDLTLARCYTIDRDDLTGRGDTTMVARETRIDIGGVEASILGIPSVGRRQPPMPIVCTCDCQIGCRASPYGNLPVALRTAETTVTWYVGYWDDPDVEVVAPYHEILDWLNGKAILGHLLYRGARVKGDIQCLSALEGVVSAPRIGATDQQHMSTLTRYAAARSSAATIKALDTIEEVTTAG
jgi:hypothetical protein